ncbi:MAG: RtcB family protein [Alphaproteobacteria bacterium]|nr:RtcB family protein [Alphaproteobacteria bacterium]
MSDKRLLRALAREGLQVERHQGYWSVRLAEAPDAPPAEVLLPDSLPLESKALRQLAALAAARHPAGGRVLRAAATPDFHPGDSGVAIGSVVETEGMLIPAAVGSDINCGMRLHVVDLSVDAFLAQREAFVARMRGDYLLGTRDLPMPAEAMRGLFRHGLLGWLDALGGVGPGQLAASDLDQLLSEAERVMLCGSMDGDLRWAPEDLRPEDGLVRDGGMATIGGGNHFVEIGVVEALVDRRRAWQLGVKEGALSVLIHSGSRFVGKGIGGAWRRWAIEAWPRGLEAPRGGLYPLSLADHPELVEGYLRAQATAANYGFLNRALLAELLRLRLRELHGALEAPLVCDLPHNITLPEGAGWVTRKGACPAHAEQPVLIPGSMGTPSFLAVGRGNPRTLCSASHGAGRACSRFSMSHRDAAELGLEGVDCVTLRPERLIQEAPAAYKPITPVIEAQVQAGSIDVVARLRPLMTFKA